MDDVKESIVEAKRHLCCLRNCTRITALQLVNNGFNRIEFLASIGPQNEGLLEEIQTPSHDFLIIFIAAIIKRYLDEEIEAYFCCSVIELILNQSNTLFGFCFGEFGLGFFVFPLDIDEAHIGSDFLD